LTNCLSKKAGAKNFNHNAALAENVAATTKSVLSWATDVSISFATLSGSAPAMIYYCLMKDENERIQRQERIVNKI
jgi:4-diphosphocytidyl-2C-methyl-D-erythritol kinase